MILNYLNRICQLKTEVVLITLLFFFNSCANKNIENKVSIDKTHLYRALWNKVPKKFSHKDPMGKIIFNPFFDLLPAHDFRDKTINYVPLTLKDSRYSYDINLLSGKKYKKFRYCQQEDVWKGFPGELNYPTFDRGFIPRIINQVGDPQEIIVFGRFTKEKDKKKRLKTKKEWDEVSIRVLDKPYRRVRVVGGVLDQYCDSYPCDNQKRWVSKLLLVGVYPDDQQLKETFTLKALKKKITWSHVRAFLENSNGKNVRNTETPLPAQRIVGQIAPDKALRSAFTKGHVFSAKELMTLRSSCHALYDYVWNSVLLTRANESIQKKKDANKYISNRKLTPDPFYIKKYPIKGLKEKVEGFALGDVDNTTKRFRNFFFHFIKNYESKYMTCSKYVRPSNINFDYERHWFFSYFESFFKLKQLDYVFSCNNRAWVKNPFNASKGSNDYDFMSQISRCNQEQLDEAFERSVLKMETTGHHSFDTFRYITYDMGAGGSHEKIYSWVKYPGKRLVCLDKDGKKAQKINQMVYFPPDLLWQKFYQEDIHSKGIILVE